MIARQAVRDQMTYTEWFLPPNPVLSVIQDDMHPTVSSPSSPPWQRRHRLESSLLHSPLHLHEVLSSFLFVEPLLHRRRICCHCFLRFHRLRCHHPMECLAASSDSKMVGDHTLKLPCSPLMVLEHFFLYKTYNEETIPALYKIRLLKKLPIHIIKRLLA
ncbi:hypothetical protein PIB30_071268 [Stylosanthes scabra]|uniref:Uncharacterized protein n=1 Tax=Stylosanthes scabra TaxID=79078 RepID=A0ABU6TNE1_9FABA|nr:hypothetical protein [Stylosanthes scabra]